MVMLFEKASTRTRISFEVATAQFGGHTLFLDPEFSQLSRGESLSDTARVISSMANLIVMRTYAHDRITLVAENSKVPVINAMSDSFHPCQLLADVLTFIEKRGQIRDAKVAWIGDGNNVCHSWIHAAHQFGFDLRLACPTGYEPRATILEAANKRVKLMDTPDTAVSGCDLVVTDTWLSIGNESEKEQRLKAFAGFCVTNDLMQTAKPDALFMHCLPAERGIEVTDEVCDADYSIIIDEAENRMFAQNAIMLKLFKESDCQIVLLNYKVKYIKIAI